MGGRANVRNVDSPKAAAGGLVGSSVFLTGDGFRDVMVLIITKTLWAFYSKKHL